MKRAVVFGKNGIAIECTKILLEKDQVELVGCCPNNSDVGEDGWQKSFTRYCEENSINTFRFESIKHPDSLTELRNLNLDFAFSFQYDQIITQRVLDVFAEGAINVHFSPLPKYRGVSPVAWALLNGERAHGVTMHYIDPGIDTGDIIAQANFEIDSVKNAKELYLRCESSAIGLFKENIDKVLNGENRRDPQLNSRATYYAAGGIDFNNSEINFRKTTFMLNNWIRAFIFPPFQYPSFELEGKQHQVVRVTPIYEKNTFEPPGSLVSKEDNKFVFSTTDGYIELEVK